MALLLRLTLILSLIMLLLSLEQTVQAATFSFSTTSLTISEGGDLSRELFIIKTGDNVDTITFRVTVMSGTADENTDYVPNSDHDYVFTSNTRSLPIQTRLVTDRAGEGIERFMICLPTQSQFNSQGQGAMVALTHCVNITIIDDDSVVIGFQDSSTSVDITEGDPPQMICAEVKSFGLELDPFDMVPLDLRTAQGSGISLGTSTLTFTADNIVRCTTISVANNNLVDGTRTSQVMLAERSPPTTTVPTELYPPSSQVVINDNDADVIGFRFDAESSYAIMEGDRFGSIRIMKYGNPTSLTFTVTPMVEARSATSPSSLADINVMEARFAPLISEGNIVVQAVDNLRTEEPKQFTLSIDKSKIRAVDNVSGINIVTGGDPVQITVYDNDFEIGFTQERFEVSPNSKEVCVKIFKPHDVHPNTNIPLSISVKNSTDMVLEMNDIILNSANKMMACIDVLFRLGGNTCTDYGNTTLELALIHDTTNSIIFLQNSTSITCSSSMSKALNTGETITVVFVLVAVIGVVVVVPLTVFLVHVLKKKRRQEGSAKTEKENKVRTYSNLESPGEDTIIMETSEDKHPVELTQVGIPPNGNVEVNTTQSSPSESTEMTTTITENVQPPGSESNAQISSQAVDSDVDPTESVSLQASKVEDSDTSVHTNSVSPQGSQVSATSMPKANDLELPQYLNDSVQALQSYIVQSVSSEHTSMNPGSNGSDLTLSPQSTSGSKDSTAPF